MWIQTGKISGTHFFQTWLEIVRLTQPFFLLPPRSLRVLTVFLWHAGASEQSYGLNKEISLLLVRHQEM